MTQKKIEKVENTTPWEIVAKINEIIDYLQPVELPTTDTGSEVTDNSERIWFCNIWLTRKIIQLLHDWNRLTYSHECFWTYEVYMNPQKNSIFTDKVKWRDTIADKIESLLLRGNWKREINGNVIESQPKPVEPVWLEDIMKKISKALWWSEYKRWDEYNDVYNILAPYITGKQEEEWYASPQEALEDCDRQIKESVGIDTTPPVTSTIEELANKIFHTVCVYFNTNKTECESVHEEIKKHLSSLSPIEKKRSKQDIADRYDKDTMWYLAVINFITENNLLQE